MNDAVAARPLSVIIPTHRRIGDLARCLQSVFAADLPHDAEVLIVCNGEDAATRQLLDSWARQDARLVTIYIKQTSPAAARNAGLSRAAGEIIYFLDDDVTVAPDLFARAIATFAARPEVAVVGGPNLTPPESGTFEDCVGRVLGSAFGAARVRDRYRSHGVARIVDDASLILCNLAFRRCAISALLAPFGEHMVCNEENVLLGELGASGAQMLHDPDLVVYHRRRATLVGFCQQTFKYGRGRWQNTIASPSSLSAVFVVPLIFALYLFSLMFVRNPLYLVPLATYLMLLFVCSAIECYRFAKPKTFPLFLVLFPTCHLSYGAGFLYQMTGSISLLTAKGRVVRSAS